MPLFAVLRGLAAAVLLSGSAFAGWAALQPGLAPPNGYGVDKAVHIAAFAVLGALAALAFPRHRALLVAALALLGLGAGIEIGQSLVAGRQGSVLDWLGDALGITLGLVLTKAVLRRPSRGGKTF